MYALSGIRTHIPGNQAAAFLRLGLHVKWYRFIQLLAYVKSWPKGPHYEGP
jgi:hypothetical protein